MPTYVDGKGVCPLIRGINAGAARAIRLRMIYTFDKLQAAWREEIHGKHEQENQARYEYLREHRLMRLKDDLIAHTYAPSPLRNKQIYIPKRRVAQVPGLEDKIVQRLICKECVYDNLTKSLIRDTYACIRGRGTSDADERLNLQLHRYWNKYKTPPYILKCDIHSYFAIIDHARLSRLIDRYIADADAREIVYKFLNLTEVGLPLGLEQNQLLANLYLSELDHMVKSKWHGEFYGRYMDDFFIISNDPAYLTWLWGEIDCYVQSIGLTLNPKTAIFYRRFDFLGFTYLLTDAGKVVKRIAKTKRKTARNRCRLLANQIADGEITMDKAEVCYRAWRQHANEGDCRNLILAMDEKFRRELQKHGYDMKIVPYHKNNKRKERVKIFVKNTE